MQMIILISFRDFHKRCYNKVIRLFCHQQTHLIKGGKHVPDFNFKQLKLPSDKKTLIYFAVSGLTLLLLLITLIYTVVNSGTTPPPIEPVNPLTGNSSESRSQPAGANDSSTAPTKNGESGNTSSSTSTDSSTKESSPPGLKNVIIDAVLAATESNNGESINTFTVNKAIEEKGLVAIVTEVAVAKINETDMEAFGYKGNQGLIDITLQLENKSNEAISIKPEEIKFTVNGKDYPLAKTATLKNMTIEKGQKVENTDLTFVMPELENADAIKEISFNWQTTGKTTQDYNVLLVLNKS